MKTSSSKNRGAKYPLQLRSRVNHEQLEQIKSSAEMAGMSVCKYVRHRATGSTVVSRFDSKILRELNLIGNRLVYISKQGYDVSEVISDLRKTVKKIQE